MKTAVRPQDWVDRAITLTLVPGPDIKVSTPHPDDLALSKLCVWRDKDVNWLKECCKMALINTAAMRTNAAKIVSANAPPLVEVLRRIGVIEAAGSAPL